MNESKRCPIGFIDIGGICVPKKRVVRKSLNYQSLFASDSATHNAPDDIDVQGGFDDVDYNEADQMAGGTVVDNSFSKHGEQGQWVISNAGVITLIYDNGFIEYIQPDQYAEFLTNDQYVFTEKIVDFLMPYMTPEISQEIYEAENQGELDEETDLLGPVNYSITNSFNYVNEDGNWRQGSAHLYDDHAVIFDTEGNKVVDASISHDVEGKPNHFSVTYNGSDFVYNNSSVIKGMDASEPLHDPEREPNAERPVVTDDDMNPPSRDELPERPPISRPDRNVYR